MTRRKPLRRTAALLLCVFLCLGVAFSMMGAACAAGVEPYASGITIEIMLPVDWASTSAAARVCVKDVTGGGFASAEVRVDRSGWQNVTASMERCDNRSIPARAQVCPEPDRPAKYRPDDTGATRSHDP